MSRKGERGSPCVRPLSKGKKTTGYPFYKYEEPYNFNTEVNPFYIQTSGEHKYNITLKHHYDACDTIDTIV